MVFQPETCMRGCMRIRMDIVWTYSRTSLRCTVFEPPQSGMLAVLSRAGRGGLAVVSSEETERMSRVEVVKRRWKTGSGMVWRCERGGGEGRGCCC